MLKYFKCILFGLLFTFIALSIATIISFETSNLYGINYAIASVAIFNLFWAIPYFKKLSNTNDKKSIFIILFIYLIFLFPFLISRIINKDFNSEDWKNQLDYNSFYCNHPYHKNGDMLISLIESNSLVGMTIEEIHKILGNNYYVSTINGDILFEFPYNNKKLFDNCDHLYIHIHNGICTSAELGDCD